MLEFARYGNNFGFSTSSSIVFLVAVVIALLAAADDFAIGLVTLLIFSEDEFISVGGHRKERLSLLQGGCINHVSEQCGSQEACC